MRRCATCAVDVEGDWRTCPLCGAPAEGETTPDPYPTIALEYSRKRIFRLLFAASAVVILGSLGVQLLFGTGEHGIGVWRTVWMSVVAMWMVVGTAVRKRRNLAKTVVYLVILVGLLCAYWDYLAGWDGWALSYAVPATCGGAILALLLTVRIVRIEVGEHIVHTGLAVLLGLAPLVFVGLGWVREPLPSVACGVLSFLALALLVFTRGAEVRHELGKRLHL